MNTIYQALRQSFPTDVTSPAPTQLSGPKTEPRKPDTDIPVPPNPPQPRPIHEQERQPENAPVPPR